MKCPNCGRELNEGAKFCNGCGTAVSEQQSVYTPTEVGEPGVLGNNRRGKGLMIGMIAGALALVVVLVLVVGGLFGGAKATVGKAFIKSAGEFAEIGDIFGMSVLQKIVDKQAVTYDVKLEMEDGYLDGLGINLSAGVDVSGKKAGITGTATFGSTELINAFLTVNNDTVTFYLPELMDPNALSFNTETLGKDLEHAGLTEYDEELEDLSFNLFDLMQSGESVKELDPAVTKALVKAIEVEKQGKETVEVNGQDLKCAAYVVRISEDALEDYLDALEDYAKEQYMNEAYMETMENMGADVDDLEHEMENSIESLFGTLKDAVEAIGDLELMVYIKGGYVMAVETDLKMDGDKLSVSLQLGGGKNYVDDLSLTMKVDGEKITIESTGDHAAKKGVFTDTTVLSYKNDYGTEKYEIETEYDSKKKEDNFSCEISDPYGDSIELEGTLLVTGDSVTVKFEDLELDGVSLSGEYTIKAYENVKIGASKTLKLADMDEDALQDFAEEIEENMYDLVEDFEDNEELYDLIWTLQYLF